MTPAHNRICFLFNLTANNNRAEKQLNRLKELSNEYWGAGEIEILPAGNQTEVHRPGRLQSFNTIVACGGDGTLHEAANLAASNHCVLGLIPMGSGNDFAKAIRMPKNLTDCLDIIRAGKTQKIDLLKFTGDAEGWCINTLGMGLDGLANVYTKKYKPVFGPLGYIIGAVHSAITSQNMECVLTLDGKKSTGIFRMITACNGAVEGGFFHVAPGAVVNDGKLDLVTIRSISFPKLMYNLPAFRNPKPFTMKELGRGRYTEVDIKTNSAFSAHADGEHLGSNLTHLHITTVPKRLDMLVP